MFFNEKYAKYIKTITWLFFAVLVCSYGYYLISIFSLGEYLPSRSDEMGYFLEAKGFAETWRVAPFVMQDEMIAPWFDLGPHGPMYSFTHGMFGKIFGMRGINFVFMNLIFLFAYFLLIWKSRHFDKEQKLALFLIQYGYFVTFFFTFAFNQEVIHIFFGALLALNMITMYLKNEKSEKLNWQDVLIFVLLMLLATSYRYGWVLSSLVIIPLAKNKKDFVQLSLLTFVILVVGQVYRKYCHAASEYTLLQNVPSHIAEGRADEVFKELSQNIVINLKYYFFTIYKYSNYYWSKILYFALTCYFLYIGLSKKDKLCLAAGLLGLSNFLALIVLYNAYDYREIRGLAGALAILVIIMVYRKLKTATTIFAVYTILTFPFMFKEFNWLIYEKEVASTKLYLEKKVADFSVFANAKSNGKKLITIMIPEKLFWVVTPGMTSNVTIKDILHTPLLTAPTRNFEGVPMRYTFNYWEINDDFKQRGRIPIDYVYIPNKGLVPNSEAVKALSPSYKLQR